MQDFFNMYLDTLQWHFYYFTQFYQNISDF